MLLFKELCEIYQREFNEMFIDGQFGATSPSTLDQQELEISIAGQPSKITCFLRLKISLMKRSLNY